MSFGAPRSGPRLVHRPVFRIGILIALGVLVGGAMLARLLPTWTDVRDTYRLNLVGGRSRINDDAFQAPLPPPKPGFQGPRVAASGGRGYRILGPLPEVPAGSHAGGDPATGKSYEFYMQQLNKAHEFEARRRAERNARAAPLP